MQRLIGHKSHSPLVGTSFADCVVLVLNHDDREYLPVTTHMTQYHQVPSYIGEVFVRISRNNAPTPNRSRSRVFVAFQSSNAALGRAIIVVPVKYDPMYATPSIEKMEPAKRGEELVQRRRSALDVPRAVFHL